MSESRLLELLAKRDAGGISLPEQKELSDIIKKDESLAEIAAAFNSFSKQEFVFTQPKYNNPEKRWATLKEALDADVKPQKSLSQRLKKWTIAASILIAIVAGSLLLINNKLLYVGSQNKHIVKTKKGSKSYLELPDGSKVWLNSATEIWYDESFGEDTRNVTLSGEAYFDIVKDSRKPFTVHTKVMDITVLGTTFNVSAYANSSSTETTLIRGVVEVELNKHKGKKVTLKPFEKISVLNDDKSKVGNNTETNLSQIYSLNTVKKIKGDSVAGSVETQWTQNKLVFVNATLDEIARRLSLWYDVEIKITAPFLKTEKYNARFDDATLEEVMQSLELTERFKYSINGRTVTIMP